uniref:Uncharacterized protein n=1 Tax=Lepeophtheirus salmonis TaxID=72036 RepID=A0A0K2VDS4_LEPSM
MLKILFSGMLKKNINENYVLTLTI